MTFPEVQFVAAPEDGAEVLFDFNDNFGLAPAQIIAGSFSLGTPTVEGDPDGLGVQYGPREVSFSLLVFGSRYAAMETQANLARTFMLRRRGWLRVKLDEFTSPVWLRTYTPTPSELDFSLIQPDSVEDAWQIEVAVAAEPFIRGERVELGPYEINNNPAHATNPMGVTLPEIFGDAPAPLRITAAFSHTLNQHDILWATAAVPAGYEPTVWQIGTGDGWSAANDTGAGVADSNFSGGSYRPVTFATLDTMATRILGQAPSAPAPGRYKVMLRVARNGISSFAFQFGYKTPNAYYYDGSKVAVMDRGANVTAAHATWVDLGDFDFPLPRATGMQGVSAIPEVALAVQRIEGDDSCLLDAMVLLPLDLESVTSLEPWEKVDALVSEFSGYGPQAVLGARQVWDGDSETSVRLDANDVLDGLDPPVCRGKFPTVRPGVTNRLTLIQQVRLSDGDFGTVDNPDLINSLASVTLSYQPRWLWLGDG